MAGAPPVWPLDLDQEELTGESGEQFNPILIDDARDILCNIVRGNGVDPDSVVFIAAVGDTLHLTLPIVFRGAPEFSKRILPGKQRGTVVPSIGAARERVAAFIAAGVRGEAWRRFLFETLKRRGDLGVGLNSLILSPTPERQNFVTHETCTTCHGRASTTCAVCHGKGAVFCRTCHGSGLKGCPRCQGRRFLDVERTQPCMRCNAQGKVDCPACHATGEQRCKACNAKGRAGCRACRGTGFRSILLSADVKVRGRFVYDPEIIPADLLQVMKDLRGSLVTLKHVDASLQYETTAEDDTTAIRQKDEIAIPCRIRMPFAAVAFDLGALRVEGEVFGFHPSPLRFPSFLETLAADGFRHLKAAADGEPGPVTENMREAAKFRVIVDALHALSRFPPLRAVRVLDKRYPAGLDAEGVRRLVSQSRAALRRLGQIGRWSGFVAGAVLTGAMDAALLSWPRSASILTSPPLGPLFVVLLIAAGFGLTTLMMREGGGWIVHRTLPFLRGNAARLKMLDLAAAAAFSVAAMLLIAGGLHRLPPLSAYWPHTAALRGSSK